MTLRDEDGDRIMEQVEGPFYLTMDEAVQQVDQVGTRPGGQVIELAPTLLNNAEKNRAGDFSGDAFVAHEQRVRSIYDDMPCGVVVWGAVDRIIEANKAAQHLYFDMSLDEMQQGLATSHPHVPGIFLRPDGTSLAQEERPASMVFHTGLAQHNVIEGFMCSNGQQRWLQVDAVPVHGEDGTITQVVASCIDVTERVEAERRAKQSEERLQTVIANVPVILYVIDRTGIITLLEGKGVAASGALGSSSAKAVVTSVFDLYHNMPEALNNVHRALAGENFTALNEVNGRMFESRFMPVRDENDDVTSVICVAIDVTERAQAEKRLHYHVLHDSLTNLPNRTLLQERLEETLLTARAKVGLASTLALLIMDLDRFKEVNETFGHQHGDFLLQQVGIRLHKAVCTTDLVARLGGDEFAILLATADETSAKKVAAALRVALEEPFIVAGYPLQVEASIGLALYPEHGTDSLALMRHADVAMYRAKRMHEGYAVYNPAHDDQNTSRRLALIGALRQAISANELTLYYQPKVDLKTGVSCSVEALARWQHATYGFVPPDQFIPLAEQTGLITPLTLWVLETAIRQCRDWLHAGLDLAIAVNLSMWNLRDATLPDMIATLLKRYAVPPRLLRVELTESAVMTDMDRALDVLKRLSALGVRISIDDFGTGYSSLAYLKRLPADELKIDRSFVQHMTAIEADTTIVRSTITMAHSLGLRIVAEGVEDQATWHLLAALDCDTAQGYYMSRPLTAQDFVYWLKNTKQPVAY